MRLHIVRHADPDYKNNTITPDGHLEAQALAKKIGYYGADEIYCSPIPRAKITMEYTSELLKIQPVFLDWLQEVNWENYIHGDEYKCPFDLPGEKLITEPDLPGQYNWMENPNFDAALIIKDLKPRYKKLNELLLSLGYKREGYHYEQIKENHEEVYLFCHAGIGLSIIAYLLNIPLSLAWNDFWLAPSSITTILFAKRNGEKVTPRCIHLNDISHLYEAKLPIKPRGFKGDFH